MKDPGARRILLSSYSNELGGVELRMAAEARLLHENGFEVVLATRKVAALVPWITRLRQLGLDARFLDVPPIFERWRWRRTSKFLADALWSKVMRSWKCDLNHIFVPWTAMGASLLWTSYVAGLPVVLSIHNAFPEHRFARWYDTLLRQSYANVAGVYAVSQSALEHYLQTFGQYLPPQANVRVIPNFVDVVQFRPSSSRRTEARRALNIPRDALVLGSVGRISIQKRPELLVRVFSQLRAEYQNLYLVLVGDGPLKENVCALASRLGVADRLYFTGYVDAVEAIIPAFDIHVLLSTREGFGIATAEAMACGIPVVGTDVPGTAEILRGSEGGVLVPADDEAAIAAGIRRLLDADESRATMGAAGRRQAESRYSKGQWSDAVLDFYQRVLGRAQ